MHKRDLCRRAVSVCLSVCPTRSCIQSKRVNISSKNFHRRVATPLFPYQSLWQYSDGDPLTGAKIAIFHQYLPLLDRRASSNIITLSGGVCVSRRQTTKFMTLSLGIILSVDWYKPKTTEQKLIVHIGKSEAEVTNNKRLHSRYCTVEAIDRYKALCGLSATA